MLIAHVTVTVILVTINLQFVCLNPHTSGYNEFHNILRLFNVLPNFPFTTSETMGDYYLQTWYIPVASGVAERPCSPLSGPHCPHKKKKTLGN